MNVRKGSSFPSYGKSLPNYPVGRLAGHDGEPVTVVRITEDGRYCLTAGTDKTIRLWNPSRIDPHYPPPAQQQTVEESININHLPQALPVQTYTVRHAASAMAIDKYSKHLFVGSNKTAILFDCVTAQVLRQFHGHTATLQSVDLITSPNHGPEILATASYDAKVCLWDGRSNNPRPLQTLQEAKDSVSCVRIHQNSIVTASIDGCLRTYDIRQGHMVCHDCHSPITHFALSRSGARMAISCLDGAIRSVRPNEPPSQQEKTIVPVPTFYRGGHVAGRYGLECSFVGDDTVVASGSEDGRIVLYAGTKNEVVSELVGHSAPTCSLACHEDVVISASYDGTCVVWASTHEYMRWTE